MSQDVHDSKHSHEHTHYLFDLQHILGSLYTCFLSSLLEDSASLLITDPFCVPLDFPQLLDDRTCQDFFKLFDSEATHLFLTFCGTNALQLAIHSDEVAQSGPTIRVGYCPAIHVRHCLLYLLSDQGFTVKEVYPAAIIWVRFTHFLRGVRQRHNFWDATLHIVHRREETTVKDSVEPFKNFADQLKMLLLVGANWYVGGFVEQHIGCHQNGIHIYSDTALAVTLFLVLDHAVQPVLRSDALEDPTELHMFFHLGLHEHGCSLWGESAGEERLSHGEGVRANRVVEARKAVIICQRISQGV